MVLVLVLVLLVLVVLATVLLMRRTTRPGQRTRYYVGYAVVGLGGLAALKMRQRGPGRHQAAPPAATELPPVDEGEGSGLPSISPVAASCSALACDACTPVPRRAQ